MTSTYGMTPTVALDADLEYRRTVNRGCRIYSLPSEVLSHIFILCQTTELIEQCEELGSRSPRFEFLITHVSFHFRDVAIGTPALWSHFTTASDLPEEAIETYLARGKSCGLNVRVDIEGVHTPNAAITAKINAVIPHLHRYQSLAIKSIRESTSWLLIRRFRNVATPNLRQLTISVDEVEDFTSADLNILQGGAPLLTSVRLRGLALQLFRPPLENVTTLHLDQVSTLPFLYKTFVDLVTASSCLQNLSVFGDIVTEQSGVTWTSVYKSLSLPHLLSLRICGIGGGVYSGLLAAISAPALESLVLKNLKERDLERLWASPQPSRMFPLLYSLTLIDSEISKDTCLEIMHGFPHITTFKTVSISEPTMLLLLSDAPADGILWPKLDTLAVTANSDNDDLIVDIVTQRIAFGCPLERLRLGMTEPLCMLPHYAWLQESVATLESLFEFDGWAGVDFDVDDNLFM